MPSATTGELPAGGTAIGAAVRTLRSARDLTVHQLADNIDLTVAELHQIESGEHEPAVATIRRLADALDTDVATVFTVASTNGLTGHSPSAGDTPVNAGGDDPVGTPQPASRRQGHYRQARANAEIVLREPALAGQLAAAARDKAADIDAMRLGDVHEDLRTLIRLLEAYATGRFRAVAFENLVLATAALRYFVSHDDIVPDHLDAGYIDDAAILAFVCEMIAPDIDAFHDWETHD